MSNDEILERSFHRLSIDGNASTTFLNTTAVSVVDDGRAVSRDGLSKEQFRERKNRYNRFVLRARDLEKQGEWSASLHMYHCAWELFSHDKKLHRKIAKLQKKQQQQTLEIHHHQHRQQQQQHQSGIGAVATSNNADDEDDEIIAPPPSSRAPVRIIRRSIVPPRLSMTSGTNASRISGTGTTSRGDAFSTSSSSSDLVSYPPASYSSTSDSISGSTTYLGSSIGRNSTTSYTTTTTSATSSSTAITTSSKSQSVSKVKPASISNVSLGITAASSVTTADAGSRVSRSEMDKHGFVRHANRDDYVLEADRSNLGLFRIDSSVYEKLYDYQRDCVRWLWKKFSDPSGQGGGILGDDMGLGKTVQICSFLQGMLFQSRMVRHVLIAAPVSVLENWKKEFCKWCKQTRRGRQSPMELFYFHGLSSAAKRREMISEFVETGGVLLTSYGMITSQVDLLSKPLNLDGISGKGNPKSRSPHFDMIILDEGHKIKNPSIKLSKCLRKLSSDHRILLTGTPIQSLDELWALYDYIFQGQLLGDAKSFKENIAKKIVRAKERDASAYEKHVGEKMSLKLRQLIDPYFLRRTKAQVLSENAVNPNASAVHDNTYTSLNSTAVVDESLLDNTTLNTSVATAKHSAVSATRSITQKNDLICWIKCTPHQVNLYKQFLMSKSVQDVLRQSSSALSSLTMLKQICNHPYLIPEYEDDITEDSIETIISKSGKLVFLDRLLRQMLQEPRDPDQVGDHKILIFSQSVKMLNIIVRVLEHRGITYLRIDGSTKNKERQRRIDMFNEQGVHSKRYQCFVLTTQVGAFGITLTTADRVILFDPSWNPAQDDQAVDRAYRIGQTRNVVVYRFITCSTIEEKIYRKQVFKGLLSKTAIQETRTNDRNKRNDEAQQSDYRFFTNQELRQLFEFGDPSVSETQQQLADIMKKQRIARVTYPELTRHIHTLNTRQDMKQVLFGLSDHDRLFEAKENMHSAEHAAMDQSVIENTVNQSMIQLMNSSTLLANDCSMVVKPVPVKKKVVDTTLDISVHMLPSGFSIHKTEKSITRKKKSQKQSVREIIESLSHVQKQVCKGVRVFGEKFKAWPNIVSQFLSRQHINATHAEAEWDKLKQRHGVRMLKKILKKLESDLEREGHPLPSFPTLEKASNEHTVLEEHTTVIDLDDTSVEQDSLDNRKSDIALHVDGQVFKPLLPVDLVPSHEKSILDDNHDDEQPILPTISSSAMPETPVKGTRSTVDDILSNLDNMFSPIPAAERGNVDIASPTFGGIDMPSPIPFKPRSPEERRESLAQVARRLSRCFGLLDDENDEDDEEKDDEGDEFNEESYEDEDEFNEDDDEEDEEDHYDDESDESDDCSFIDDASSEMKETTIDTPDPRSISKSPSQEQLKPAMSTRRLKRNVIYTDSDEDSVVEDPSYAATNLTHEQLDNSGNSEETNDDDDDENDSNLDRLSTRFSSVSISGIDRSMLSLASSTGSMMRDVSSLAYDQESSTMNTQSDVFSLSFQEQLVTDKRAMRIEGHQPLEQPAGMDYEQLVRLGHRYEMEGELVRALDYYMRALDFNDEDIKLHCKCCSLATKLGWMTQP